MIGTTRPASSIPSTLFMMAVIWGTPNPVTTARRTDRTWTDPNLDGIRARFDQVARAFSGRDVSRDDLSRRKSAANGLQHRNTVIGVAVGNVHDKHIDSGIQQRGGTLDLASRDADGRAYPQPAVFVAVTCGNC